MSNFKAGHFKPTIVIALKKFILSLCLSIILSICQICAAQDVMNTTRGTTQLLSADQVFDVAAVKKNESNITLNFVIAPGFYIYQQRLKITTTPTNELDLSHISWPSTLSIPDIEDPQKYDAVFTGAFGINLPLVHNTKPLTLHVTIQGCDGKSICYPPQTYHFEFNQDKLQSIPAAGTTPNLTGTFMRFYHGETSWQDLISKFSIIQLIVIFFCAGIAIALTPCMYPLYPIALSTIMGNAIPRRRNIAFLVLMYMQGIALVYVVVGVIAAISGKLLTTTIQTPIFMFINAGIWLILGLAMFDLIEIKLPNRLHNYIHHKSGNLNGGRGITVLVMGIVSSLLLGPCVTPPLIAAIGFIVGLGNVVLGIICLYSISLGMGVPLLILALLGGRFMPKSGKWMTWVKYMMGILLIGVSISFVYPYFNRADSSNNMPNSGLITVDSGVQLDAAIKNSNKPVLIDFYASWCTICKEMDKNTFPDTAVQSSLHDYTLIKFDLTNNTSDQIRVLQQYGLYGPPALIILNSHHDEVDRMLGYTDGTTLVNHLEKHNK